MNAIHERNFDLNLLRVFIAVADAGSVTEAARGLYLTQSAVSAALRRLATAIGAPLFARDGRGLALTARGEQLRANVRPHLEAMLAAALAPEGFDASTSDRTFRLGLSDVAETWLLPPLLRRLSREAPRMRLVVAPVQFRTVTDAFAARRLDLAITVADDLPSSIRREPLFVGSFTCLYDPRHARLRLPLRERDYFAHEHVIVSYNDDLRGVVEDVLGRSRRVRCALPSFASIAAVIDGTALLATVPDDVATLARATRPHLRSAALPFALGGTAVELLWPAAADDDDASRFLRRHVTAITRRRRRAPDAA